MKISFVVALMVVGLMFVLASCDSQHNSAVKLREMIQSGDSSGVSQLIAANPSLIEADMNQDRKEKLTPLSLAAALGQDDVCKVLIGAGAKVNVQDKFGLTPLHKAVSIADTNMIHMLLKSGADVTMRNGQDETPLDFARDRVPNGIIRGNILDMMTNSFSSTRKP